MVGAMKWLPVVVLVLTAACGPVRTPWAVQPGMTPAQAELAAGGPGCAEYEAGAFYRPHVRSHFNVDYVQTAGGEFLAACHVPEWRWRPGDVTWNVRFDYGTVDAVTRGEFPAQWPVVELP